MQCFEHNCEGNQAYIEISCNAFVCIDSSHIVKEIYGYYTDF